jgi:hypothetical protein
VGIGANGSGFELDDIIVGLEAPPGRGGAAAGGKFWRRERDMRDDFRPISYKHDEVSYQFLRRKQVRSLSTPET